MSEIAYAFAPSDPESVVVGTSQVKIKTMSQEAPRTVVYLSNLSKTATVFLGFTPVGATAGNAALNKGLPIFPESTVRFDCNATPVNCDIWAIASEADTTVTIQG